MKTLHYFSGIIISCFVVLHLSNHLASLWSEESHLEFMNITRKLYRTPFFETLLIIAAFIQIISGIRLLMSKQTLKATFFERLKLWTGGYLAFFFTIHLIAVFTGRLVLKLDTNFYFGTAGLITYPFSLFFIPYYSLAILSFFGHIAAIHALKMKKTLLKLPPKKQAYLILLTGLFITFLTFYGLTNKFKGFKIPESYHILIGK